MAKNIKWDSDTKLDLKKIDAADHGGLSEPASVARMTALSEELRDLQILLYGSAINSVLIVLQGMDTSGKDGTISHVTSLVNPQGCDVTSFKLPTPLELSHDFLWRCHAAAPIRGTIGIFNRSHYEDVLVTRVHGSIDKAECKRRYGHIADFEQLLSDHGTIILKFFLNISYEEQRARLDAREHDTRKAWKLSAADWHERAYWNDYRRAYEDAIQATSVPHAPWFIVPANRKWYRNLVIAEEITRALRPHKKRWEQHLVEIGKRQIAELAAMREAGKVQA